MKFIKENVSDWICQDEDENNMGDKVYYVSIETEEANYDSDIFPTFEGAENFALELVEKFN